MRLSKPCRHCNKEFHYKPSRPSDYCSRQCLSVHKVELTCAICASQFITFAIMEKRAKYCSDFCRARSGPIEKECGFCKENFHVRKLREEDAKFCSFKCNMSSKRRTFSCEQCGRLVETTDSSEVRFCSRKCGTDALKNRIEHECKQCRKSFEVKASQDWRVYCSKSCNSKSQELLRDYPEPAPITEARCLQLGYGKFTLVDADDYDRCSKFLWSEHKGYALTNHVDTDKSFKMSLHRMITNAPDGVDVDHIDCDKRNNRKSNLRLTNRSGNAANTVKTKTTSSKYRGVNYNKQAKRFIANITINCKMKYLGTFEDEIAAAMAYDTAAREYFKEFARLNFPTGDERGALTV